MDAKELRDLESAGLALVRCSSVEKTQMKLTQESQALAESMWRPLQSMGSDQISVVSFNMLLKGFDEKPYYPDIPAALRAWQWRKQQLERLICGIDADIYCMQEVECSTFTEEFSFLERNGYSAIAPKDDSKVPLRDFKGERTRVTTRMKGNA
eukprot:Skav214496  [mRNA]  locus=scaffold1011:192637:200951:- [translate_table: standard]